eukprot:sb/3464507/
MHQGNCFKLNPQGLLKAKVAGNLGGISLFLNSQHKQYALSRLMDPSEGFRISFHDPVEQSNIGNTAIVASPGMQYFIQLAQQETRLLKAPYGNGDCEENPTYRYSNCINDCINLFIKDTCACIPFTTGGGAVWRRRPDLSTLSIKWGMVPPYRTLAPLCTLRDMFGCVLNAYRSIVRDPVLRNSHCHCDKACRFVKYSHSVSTALLSDSFVEKLLELYNEKKKLDVDEEPKNKGKLGIGSRLKGKREKGGKFSAALRSRITKWTSDAIKDNVVVLKISFPSLEKHTVNQVVSYGFGNLLGDIGGVLGLFLGGSVFTVLEFLVYFVHTVQENLAHLSAQRTLQNVKRRIEVPSLSADLLRDPVFKKLSAPARRVTKVTTFYMNQEPTKTSKQPIKTRYLGHMTSYQPIRDQYRSVPDTDSYLTHTPTTIKRFVTLSPYRQLKERERELENRAKITSYII